MTIYILVPEDYQNADLYNEVFDSLAEVINRRLELLNDYGIITVIRTMEL